MTNAELKSKLPLLAPAYFADASYAKPTLAWLQGPFWTWFIAQRQAYGLNTWTRKNDCDNFARAYAQAAQDCHSVSQDPTNQEGLAVGEFWYHGPNGPHAIIIAVTDKGIVYLEPQNNHQLILTPSEISSCFYVRF